MTVEMPAPVPTEAAIPARGDALLLRFAPRMPVFVFVLPPSRLSCPFPAPPLPLPADVVRAGFASVSESLRETESLVEVDLRCGESTSAVIARSTRVSR